MTDAFEEVEEGLRRDKAAELWYKFAPWLIGILVVLVAVVGGWEFWKWQRAQAIEKDAVAFATAMETLEKGDLAGAKAALAPIAQGDDGFAAISHQILAGLEKELTNDNAAVEGHLSAAAVADKGLMGDIATLKLAYLKADTVDLAELTRIVDPLVRAGGAQGALARELLAAKKLAVGQTEQARADYQALSIDIDAPQQMKTRVQQVLYALPAKPAAPATPAVTPATGPATAPAQPSQPQQ